MSNADMIRNMSDDELVDLLVWGWANGECIPDCDDGCEDFCGGCADSCPHEKKEKDL